MSKPNYSPEFKRKVVEEHLKDGKSVAAVCREYHVGEVAFRRWKREYQAAGDAAAQGQAELARELAAAQKRIDELEGALGRATLEVDFMKRCFKRAGLPFPTAPKS